MENVGTAGFRPHVFVRVMAKHPEICVFLVVSLFVVVFRYGSSTFRPKPLVVPALPPKRFFSLDSIVLDFPYGNMEPVARIVVDEEFIFIMYYAPWCAKSMSVRWEFQKAARFLRHRVKFIAVNCWWKDGQCRQNNKFLEYPVLYAYHTQLNGYRYRGILSAVHMVKFVEDLIYPITVLHSEEEMNEFLASHDNSVIGYFDFTSEMEPYGYNQFFYASMRSVEQDPHQVLRFSVVTTRILAKLLRMETPTSVVLVKRWKKFVRYPSSNNFTSSQIVAWAFSVREQPLVKLLIPSGSKSLRLFTELSKGAAVILFTVFNPLFDVNQYISKLNEAAMVYADCTGDSFREAHNCSISQRLSSMKKLKADLDMCKEWRKMHRRRLACKCCVSVPFSQSRLGNQYHNICEVCLCHFNNCSSKNCNFSFYQDSLFENHMGALTNSCLDTLPTYNRNTLITVCCHQYHKYCGIKDNFVLRRTLSEKESLHGYNENEVRKICERLNFQRSERILPDYVSKWTELDDSVSNFTGLKCLTNRTVGFYAMDVVNHWMFAERFGFNASRLLNQRQPGLVLVDKEDEKLFIMNETFSKKTLAAFIKNYTSGILERHKQSAEYATSACDQAATPVCVVEVTSSTFVGIIMDNEKDVVLLYYSPWCGFCAWFSHIYLLLAKYFKSAKNIVIARINGDTEDLPWEFTVDSYPTILLFPAQRKENSIVFPETFPKTLPNLVRFVLNHAAHEVKVGTALRLCTYICIMNNRKMVAAALIKLDTQVNQLEIRAIRLASAISDSQKLFQNSKLSMNARSSNIHQLKSWLAQTQVQLRETKQKIYDLKLLLQLLYKSDQSLDRDSFLKLLKLSDFQP